MEPSTKKIFKEEHVLSGTSGLVACDVGGQAEGKIQAQKNLGESLDLGGNIPQTRDV